MKKNNSKKTILITGAAGFIGFHLSRNLLEKNYKVMGIDNINSYYSVKLKKDRLKILKKYKNFIFKKIDLSNFKQLNLFLRKKKIDVIYNLAAQAGVRYSLKDPKSYIKSNIEGFHNILEITKLKKIRKFIYASSSSVYGDQKKFPTTEKNYGEQKNLYSLSKNFNEKLAQLYYDSFKTNSIGLRFFTVYGEWGRPDMLYYKYMNAIKERKTIQLYNFGNHTRDFTYISDVVDILCRILDLNEKKYFRNNIFNICSGNPINLISYLKFIDKTFGKKCNIKKIPKQNIEILKTHGSNEKIRKLVKKKNFINYKDGLIKTVNWFKKY